MNEEITLFPEPISSAPSLTSRWRRYCNFLKTKWWLPVVTASMASAAMAVYLDQEPITYFSEASMFVSGKLRLPESNLYYEDLDLGTEIQVLQSYRIQARAYARVGTLNPDSNAPPVRVKITQVPRSKVIELRVIGSYPSYTKAYLQAIIDEYLTYKKGNRALSSEVNPIPVKAAISMRLGFSDEMRLPLTSASPKTKQLLDFALAPFLS
jgi:uncharacterized protein involved in exopolysaccharide biosynthesis